MACAAGGPFEPAAHGAVYRRPLERSRGARQQEKGIVMKLSVRIIRSERGDYVATCPSLPGCVTRGQTLDEARQVLGEAIRGYLASVSDFVCETITEETIVEV
jgi:predicted RNase H-like HicB family nuclease